MPLELPSLEDIEAAEDILIRLGILRVSESSDHIQRYTTVTDPKEDKDSVIAEVADIIMKRVKKATFKIDDSSLARPDEPRENYSSRGNPLPMPPCYRCGGSGSITHFGTGADDGHDIDLNCPVCNPKYVHDDDRDWYEPDHDY